MMCITRSAHFFSILVLQCLTWSSNLWGTVLEFEDEKPIIRRQTNSALSSRKSEDTIDRKFAREVKEISNRFVNFENLTSEEQVILILDNRKQYNRLNVMFELRGWSDVKISSKTRTRFIKVKNIYQEKTKDLPPAGCCSLF